MREHELTEIQKRLKSVLGPRVLQDLGKTSEFIKRRRTITSERFVGSLLKSLGARRVESIADLLRDFNYDHGESVCYKPYYNKLDGAGFPRLMRSIADGVLRTLCCPVLRAIKRGPFARFRDILIQDGSSFALHDALTPDFPGRFTTVSPAAVEIQMTMSLYQDSAIFTEVTADSECERHYLPPPEAMRNLLVLADRGYDSTEYMLAVESQGGHFLIRIRRSLDPIVTRIYRRGAVYRRLEGESLNDVLKRAPKKECLDIDVGWQTKSGQTTWQTRVVAVWNSRDKAWIRLMTNLSRAEFPSAELLRVYRLRWQIELLFKELKSYANLHKFSTTKAAIAEGLIWASLVVVALKRYFAHACEHALHTKAISTRRVAMCGHIFLPDFCRSIVAGFRDLDQILRSMFRFLEDNAQRTNRKRERLRGRLALGLALVAARS